MISAEQAAWRQGLLPYQECPVLDAMYDRISRRGALQHQDVSIKA